MHPKIWQPLGPDEIRILDFYPSNTGIICRLRTINLYQQPAFDALSYCWARAEGTCKITLNNLQYVVSETLHDALMVLSHLSRPLWIDAICIDQADNLERNRQVTMMGDIYKNAHTVRVWLGTDFANVASILDDLCEKPRHLEARHLIPVHSLLDHPWWTRAWTLQEAVLAQRLLFYMGGHAIESRRIETYLQVVKHHKYGECCSLEHSHQGREYDAAVAARFLLMCHPPKDMSLLEALSLGRSRHATNPQDKVYAFLGLTKQRIPGVVRYDMTPEQSYVHFAKAHIEYTSSLEILQYVGTSSTGYTLPSWCPNWSRTVNETGWSICRSNESSRFRPEQRPTLTGGRLSVKGVVWDTIVGASLPFAGVDIALWLDNIASMLRMSGFINDEQLQATIAAMVRAVGSRTFPGKLSSFAQLSLTRDPASKYSYMYTVLDVMADSLAVRFKDELWSLMATRSMLVHVFAPDDYEREIYNDHSELHNEKIDEWPFGRKDLIADVRQRLIDHISGLKMLVSRKGYIGMGSNLVQNEDAIVILYGCSLPCILRWQPERDERVPLWKPGELNPPEIERLIEAEWERDFDGATPVWEPCWRFTGCAFVPATLADKVVVRTDQDEAAGQNFLLL